MNRPGQSIRHNTRTKSNKQSELFFKLHELQTCSWGASQIGRVAQVYIKYRCVHHARARSSERVQVNRVV
jgi:hypothetical protein